MKARLFLRACAIYPVTMAFLILALTTICTADVINSSFEADGSIVYLDSGNATGWSDNISGSSTFYGEVSNSDFYTDGNYGVVLLAPSAGVFSSGENAYVSQLVDLTGIGALKFDARLSVHPDGPWLPFLEADFYVDSTNLWSKQTIGIYQDQSIDLTGFTGIHTIEFRLQANSQGNTEGEANWYEFDNVRLTPVPEPSGMVIFAAGAISLLVYAWQRRKPAA
jgi:hypothetical protein